MFLYPRMHEEFEANSHRDLLLSYETIEVGEQAAIAYLADGYQLYYLNKTSYIIWQLYVLDGHSIGTIAKELAKTFSLPYNQIRTDIINVISTWRDWKANMYDGKANISISQCEDDRKYVIINENDFLTQGLCLSFSGITFGLKINCVALKGIISDFFGPMCDATNNLEVHYQIFIAFLNDKVFLCNEDGLVHYEVDSKEDTPRYVRILLRELCWSKLNWLILAHAGGVSVNNQAIIFPASSGSGKSTLIATLVKHGYHYINDDVIPILQNQTVQPMPVPINIKSGSWPILEHLYPEIRNQKIYHREGQKIKFLKVPQNATCHDQPEIAYFIYPKYHKDCEKSMLEQLDTAYAFQLIIETNSFLRFPYQPEDLLGLYNCLRDSKCYKLTYSNLTDAINLIDELSEKELNLGLS